MCRDNSVESRRVFLRELHKTINLLLFRLFEDIMHHRILNQAGFFIGVGIVHQLDPVWKDPVGLSRLVHKVKLYVTENKTENYVNKQKLKNLPDPVRSSSHPHCASQSHYRPDHSFDSSSLLPKLLSWPPSPSISSIFSKHPRSSS